MASQLVIDIERRFSERSIIAQATLEIPAGRSLVLFGPSGSGKTTILRAIAGLERPDEGAITFDGETWFDSGRRIMISPQDRRVGYLSQSYDLFPHLTVRQNVRYGAGPRFDVDEILERFGITSLAGRRPPGLSGGEKQRVALARTLAREPRILLLDEPLSALDSPTRTSLRSALRAIVEASAVPAIIVTHDRTEALGLGDTIAVVIDGRIAQVGSVESVFNHPGSVAVARATGVETVAPVEIASADPSIIVARAGTVEIECSPRDETELKPGDRAFALVHAHEVTIERHRTEGISARNQLSGVIRSMSPEGPLVRIRIDCGFELTALITTASARELELAEDTAVLATIKASAVQLVPR